MKISYIHLHANSTNFYLNCFALSLAMIERLKTIRKWPIGRSLILNVQNWDLFYIYIYIYIYIFIMIVVVVVV